MVIIQNENIRFNFKLRIHNQKSYNNLNSIYSLLYKYQQLRRLINICSYQLAYLGEDVLQAALAYAPICYGQFVLVFLHLIKEDLSMEIINRYLVVHLAIELSQEFAVGQLGHYEIDYVLSDSLSFCFVTIDEHMVATSVLLLESILCT